MHSYGWSVCTVLAMFLAQTSAALENLNESDSNPASVEAKVSRPCSFIQERLGQNFAKTFTKVPFVKSVNLTGRTDWAKKSEDNNTIVSEHTTYHMVRTTSPNDFPMSVLSSLWTKSECKPNAKGCSYNASVVTEGKNALQYETRVAFGPTGNYVSSFNSTIQMSGVDNNVNCHVRMTFQVLDNHYLWLKRHLVRKDVDPVTIQKAILKGHNQWARKILPDLESNL